MARTLWIIIGICAATASGCATASRPSMASTRELPTPVFDTARVEVRNYDGEVLPPYALNEATDRLEVECLDGQVYEIIDRPQELYSPSNKTTAYARPASADDICDRILTTRTQRRTR
jgi:hypothetical protein